MILHSQRPKSTGIPELYADRTEVDFGTVAPGSAVNTVFQLMNRGDHPIEIFDVKSDCGCTVATLQERVIPPHGVVSIPVRLSVGSASATRLTRHVSVQFQGSQIALANPLTLTVTAFVAGIPRVTAIPALVNFTVGNRKGAQEAEVLFRGPRVFIDSLPNRLVIESLTRRDYRFAVRGGGEEVVDKTVTLCLHESNFRDVNTLQDFEISLILSGTIQQELPLRVRIEPEKIVEITPRHVLMTVNADGSGTSTIFVRGNSESLPQIDLLESMVPLTWTIQQVGDSKLARVDIQAGPAAANEWSLLRELTLHCANPPANFSIPVTIVKARRKDAHKDRRSLESERLTD